MKVIVPTTIADITLGQYQSFDLISNNENTTESELESAALRIFVGLTDEQIKAISQNDKEALLKDITTAMNQKPVFDEKNLPTFKLKDTEFGFHNNLDSLSAGAYGDLMEYSGDVEDYHRLMAIVFRPITGKDILGNYTIAEYNGTELWCEVMKQTPMHYVQSALFFFRNLAIELRKCTHKFSKEVGHRKVQRRQIFGILTDGTPVL